MSDRKLLKQKIIQEQWQSGILYYKLKNHQTKLYSEIKYGSQKKHVVNCSRRFGKTFVLCLIATEKALSKPKIHIRFAAPTQKQLTEIIQPIFDKILADCPDLIKPEYKSQDKKYVFKNGSEIHIAGCDNGNAENLRGHESDLNIIDEAGFISDLEYVLKDILMPQTLTTGGRTIISSTPPRTPAHYFERLCREAIQGNYYSKFTIHDNDSIPLDVKEEYCKESGGSESTTWKREYLCEFVVDETIVIVPEWSNQYIGEIEWDAWRAYYDNYVSMDIGGRHKTVIVYGYYDFRKGILQIIDESVLSGQDTTTDLIAKTVQEKESFLFSNLSEPKRIADNNNVILLQDLSILHNVHFAPTSKDHLIAMVNKLRVFIGQERLKVSPKCHEVIGCLSTGIWNKQRTQFDVSDLYGHFDALASLIYMVRNLDQSTNPIPKTGIAHPYTHHINLGKLEENGSELKKLFRRK